MKRLFLLLLAICLLLSGCGEQADLPQEPEKAEPSTEQNTENENNQLDDPMPIDEDGTVAVYNDRIYFSCGCNGAAVYVAAPDALERAEIVLEGGSLIGQCGTELLAIKGGNLLRAEPLSDDLRWETVGAVERMGGAPIRQGELWYFINAEAAGATVYDAAEKSIVSYKIPEGIEDWEYLDGMVYYTVAAEKGYLLYAADLQFKQINELSEVEHPKIALGGDRIACYDEAIYPGAGYPGIYDMKSDTYEQVKVGYEMHMIRAGGGVLLASYCEGENWSICDYAMDIATGKELNGEDYRAVRISDCGRYVGFQNRAQEWRYQQTSEVCIEATPDIAANGSFVVEEHSFGKTVVRNLDTDEAYTLYHAKLK